MAMVSCSFIYTSQLPASLQLSHAQQLLSAMEAEERLQQPAQLLRDFLNSHSLKTRTLWHMAGWSCDLCILSLTGHVTCVPHP